MPSFSDNNGGSFVTENKGIKTLVPRAAKAQIEPAAPGAADEPQEQLPKSIKSAPMATQTASPSADHTPLDVRDLPSQGLFYANVTHIHVRRLRLGEQRELSRSRALDNMRLEVNAIGRTIDFPVNNLTAGDYQYLLHWHRLNSFKKGKSIVNFYCTDPEHVKRVTEAKGKQEDLHTEDSNPQFVSLVNYSPKAEELNTAMEKFYDKYGVYTFVERVEDLVELAEMDDDQLADLGLYMEYASLLSPDLVAEQINADPKLASQRLQLRAKWMRDNEDSLDGDFIHDLEEIRELSAHGVDHNVKVVCKGCGASAVKKLTVDAGSFLP